MNTPDLLTIAGLLAGYRSGALTPAAVLEEVLKRIAQAPEHHAWITRLDAAQVQAYVAALAGHSPATKPLFGIPFAIKDNIDLKDIRTTAACAEFAYVPQVSATVVDRLVAAGAIPVGKTNLDQFATGLVGTRSPYGAGRNSFNPDYISGGSSAGSAVTVAQGLVSFSLGSDTAGSGRVPAGFNNLIGVKPTCGLLSTRGMVPACRSLDCVSIFALTAADAAAVLQVAQGFDAEDAYSRRAPANRRQGNWGQSPTLGSVPGFRFGVPPATQLEFFGDSDYARLFDHAVARLESLGGRKVAVDFTPFLEVARLLYEGPWVSERYAAIEGFLRDHPEALHPVTRQIIRGGERPTAVDAFRAQYRLKELQRTASVAWELADVLITPTSGTIYRIAEVEADPVRLNATLGRYTNFLNLLDLAAVAVPAGFRSDGLPFGVTLVGPAFTDTELLALGSRLHAAAALPLGATGKGSSAAADLVAVPVPDFIPVAVCGAHMTGLPLNPQLTERGAYLVKQTRSAAAYRLYALPGGPPQRPGMVRVAQEGAAIELEVWNVPSPEFGRFVAGIPSPLGIGKVVLEDGDSVPGFVCEPLGLDGAVDITAHGGWRAWLAAR